MSQAIVARVSQTVVWTPGLVTLRLDHRLDGFAPGQFLNIGVAGDAAGARRAYSIASAPGAALEFYVTEVPGGALSPSLCSLPAGTEVLLDAHPQGFFTLKWVPEAKLLWLVATGTGLGPYVSMLRSGEPFTRFERVILVHGVRHTKDLGYAEELRALVAQRAGQFEYVPVVSRESAPGDVALGGRLTTALSSGALEARALSVLSVDSHVMLCGNPAMIDDVLTLLGERGLKRHRTRAPGHVTMERYWD